MNCSIPVIASNLPEIQKVIRAPLNGLILESLTEPALIHIIKKALNHKFNNIELDNKYTWDFQEQKLILSYKKLLK